MKTVNEWINVLENEVESKFDKSKVNGFEDSAPSIKLAVLAEMYENEPTGIEPNKDRAYGKLADHYDVQAAWN